MSNVREFIHSSLMSYDDLLTLHNERVFQGRSMRTNDLPKPFLVHTLGNDTDENLAEVDVTPHRQFFTVWIYDNIGDYSRIDSMITLVKKALSALSKSASAGIITIRYLETSQDMVDQTYNAIFRYVRFQLIMQS